MSTPVVSAEPRTRRWAADEYCHVGAMRCAYSFDGGVMLVRLPGGSARTVAELRERGHVVTLPRRIRGWSGA